MSAGLNDARLREADDRTEAFRSGKNEAVPGPEALAELRKEFRSKELARKRSEGCPRTSARDWHDLDILAQLGEIDLSIPILRLRQVVALKQIGPVSYGIVKCCISAVCAYLNRDQTLAGSFNFSKLMQISEWKEDTSEILAYGLAALALGHDAASLDLSPIFVSETFSAQKARLLSCASKTLRTEMPAEFKNLLSDEHSFLSFLEWANRPETKFSEFASSHLDFVSWMDSMREGNDFERFLHGAAERLIAANE